MSGPKRHNTFPVAPSITITAAQAGHDVAVRAVVRGSARVVAGGREHTLTEGDTLYCSGGVPHRWEALVDDTKILLVTVSESARVTLDSS